MMNFLYFSAIKKGSCLFFTTCRATRKITNFIIRNFAMVFTTVIQFYYDLVKLHLFETKNVNSICSSVWKKDSYLFFAECRAKKKITNFIIRNFRMIFSTVIQFYYDLVQLASIHTGMMNFLCFSAIKNGSSLFLLHVGRRENH